MVLLFDIGGTKMRVSVSRDKKKVGAVRTVPTPKNFRAGVRMLNSIARQLGGGKKIIAVSGGLAGSFDRTKSRIIGGGSNIKGWTGKNIKKELERAFKAPVYLENDAALSGLAEAVKGAGQGKEIVVYYTVSTGFGGARIVRGRIDDNARGFEPSYQIIDAGGGLCRRCAGKHVGAHISGRGIEEHYHKKTEQIKDSRIREDLARWLAISLNNSIVHWSPDVLILGGPVMNLISIQRVRVYLKKIYKGYIAPPPLLKSKLGDLSVIYGALVYLNQKLLS